MPEYCGQNLESGKEYFLRRVDCLFGRVVPVQLNTCGQQP